VAICLYSFARISAVLSRNAEDYLTKGERRWIRLTE
jgi:hypothetical protein